MSEPRAPYDHTGVIAPDRLVDFIKEQNYGGVDTAATPVAYDSSEQDVILDVFRAMLGSVTKDGGRKRAAGTKPPWYLDQTHEAAIFSHLNKWKHGELFDSDSGAHTLIHLAWRCLAIAYQETYGKWDPAKEHDWRDLTTDAPRITMKSGTTER